LAAEVEVDAIEPVPFAKINARTYDERANPTGPAIASFC
jgi:hypothetical protein